MDYFNFNTGLTMTNEKFAQLFDGPPRKPESNLTQREMDLARSIQEVTEEIMLRMACNVKKETGEQYLCLAGGVALNCVGNGRLLREKIFDNIWIQPAAGDAGGALGAALVAYHHYFNKAIVKKTGKDLQKGSFLGSQYDEEQIASFLQKHKIPAMKLTTEKLIENVSELIADGKVIGWFQGRMEFGPRALGSRSILGDARSPEMQKKMNLKIKFREGFRPFAPSVLEEKVAEWFEMDNESPYMLLVAEVKKEKQRTMNEADSKLWGIEKLNVIRSSIPAVTHIDYSARVQTVNKDTNPLYYGLIERFYQKTGCPVIVNTSFNVRGEPIVESPLDAYRCFMRTEIDVLAIGNYLLLKEEQPEFHDDIDWKNRYELD
jgi:carbamoyltransferase